MTFDGKSSITFAARFVDRPVLKVGDGTGVSHNCTITVAKKIVIGRNPCRIASDVFMFDSSGHAKDPESRRTGAPPDDDDVRPITVGDDVWIGRRCIIFPGITIGAGSILSSGSIVMSDVAPGAIVAGNPARKIGIVPPPGGPPAASAPPSLNVPEAVESGPGR